ncbi:hypothetical protein BGZ83_002963 [Gryganskiella cystojenkinii]|nr:hypothetical protein BGZ83_002963 [Gryganskiella cystojenkinii]
MALPSIDAIAEQLGGAFSLQDLKPCKANPFVLPKLLLALGQQVDRPTLISSLVVSRIWHEILTPLLYTDVSVILRKPYWVQGNAGPQLYVLERYASSVRKFSLMGYFTKTQIHRLTFPNLENLSIVSDPANAPNAALAFLERHQSSIRFLSFDETTAPSTKEMINAMAGCPKLERIMHVDICWKTSTPWMTLYEKVWTRLESLLVLGSWFEPTPSGQGQQAPRYVLPSKKQLSALSKRAGPTKINDIFINLSDEFERGAHYPPAVAAAVCQAQFFVIKNSPNLVRMMWHIEGLEQGRGPIALMADEIRSGGAGWNQLEALTLPASDCAARDLALVLNALPKLTSLLIDCSFFDLDCWRALQSARPVPSPRSSLSSSLSETLPSANPQPDLLINTLTVLNLADCVNLPGSAVQEMLCSMPRLEALHVHRIADKDIVNNPRPWVCLGLKQLGLMLILEAQPITQPLILKRLAGLTQLEQLTLTCPEGMDCLQLQVRRLSGTTTGEYLEIGLHPLRTLTSMTDFTYLSFEKWGQEEAVWITKHWPKFTSLRGIDLDNTGSNILGMANPGHHHDHHH